MKKVKILRGLSGSGKSTVAKSIIQESRGSCCIVSADHFFSASGTYKFEPSKLQKAHDSCFENFVRAMIIKGIDTIIVDNTNSTRREYANYVILAKVCGYEVEIMEFQCNNQENLKLYHSRSQHGVPFYTLERMYARWEKDPRAISIK